jgi:tRNA/tmRNA/rRNA uracil-C5-methylase (TrmA/RlmC/RlmD family)
VPKKHFNDRPFAYHQEIELEITTLTNLGLGLGRVPLAGSPGPEPASLEFPAAKAAGWVVMVPFALPGEKVRARIFRNHPNFSEADLIEVLQPAPDRRVPPCPLFGRCGGCQYQHLDYAAQLQWKQRQVGELLRHLAGVDFAVAPVIPSPRPYGYRSKITPHFHAPRQPHPAAVSSIGVPGAPAFPIGFLRQGSRFELVDVPRCLIATDAINDRLTSVRADLHARQQEFKRDGTMLLREAGGVVTTDYEEAITEEVPVPASPRAATPGPLRLRFLARDFFQNNPFILPAFVAHVRDQAAASGARWLVDAYCGSGLFALAAAPRFARVAGVEISETSIQFARDNAAANGITNARFVASDAAKIFGGLEFAPAETVVVIDPPRKGCDPVFLQQLFAFGPRAVVYVSCDPATQMRDLREFFAAGYQLELVQPFDLFPQTRHLECVISLRKG